MATGEELLAMAGMGDEEGEKPSEEPDADADDYTPSAGEVLAGEEAIAAQKSGDAEAFARAVCHLIDMHKAAKAAKD